MSPYFPDVYTEDNLTVIPLKMHLKRLMNLYYPGKIQINIRVYITRRYDNASFTKNYLGYRPIFHFKGRVIKSARGNLNCLV